MNMQQRIIVAVAAGATALAGLPAWSQARAQQTQQAQAAAQSAPQGAQRPVISEYRLGAGDAVRITVYQNPDLTLEGRLTEAGSISYPLLGSVKLGGLTVAEAERRIAEGLQRGNFVRQPQVSVLVTQVRGNQASVLGQVNRPGRFPIEQGDMRLSDLLALAGGVGPTGADVVTLVGIREGRPFRREVDLRQMFSSQADVVIQNGDVVYVDRAPMVYIYGEVQRPGAFRLERDMTLLQALASGGGLTPRGTDRGIRVHRRGPDGQVQEMRPGMTERLRDGDVVYVRESLF